MKLRVDVARFGQVTNGTLVQAGAIREQPGLPVTVNFDSRQVVGTADVHTDGTADITIPDDSALAQQFKQGQALEFSIGFRPNAATQEGDVMRITDIDILTIGAITRPKP